MRVELALFDGDDLLDCSELMIGGAKKVQVLDIFCASHLHHHNAADIVRAIEEPFIAGAWSRVI